ncbi:unnamed protein product [Pleuronectes platessa]|uniref:Uncharacterized protein n=1 Tax=Pleuronectes platessa TaxID=8262 RepID=A0A9N7V4N6_PLEPL|nr:unnamed protein product [Pleuronectes platessa]
MGNSTGNHFTHGPFVTAESSFEPLRNLLLSFAPCQTPLSLSCCPATLPTSGRPAATLTELRIRAADTQAKGIGDVRFRLDQTDTGHLVKWAQRWGESGWRWSVLNWRQLTQRDSTAGNDSVVAMISIWCPQL